MDAPVRTYLPCFRVADDAASEAITVRHLLNHTSGLSDLGYNRVMPADTSLEDGVRDLRRARLTAPVGTKQQYFNPDYATLALIIEMVAGASYADFLQATVFQPLGMEHSYIQTSAARPPQIAQGHVKLFGFPVAANPPFRPAHIGGGQAVSTAPDLARFAMAISNDGALGPARILSPASVAAMRTPPAIPDTTYGMGWTIGRHRGENPEGHTGADPTFMSQLAVLPETGRGYALLTNNEHLIEAVVVTPQQWMGLLDLLQGRPADSGGVSMKLIGAVILAIFIVAIVLTIRSFGRLRGWPARSAELSAGQVARAILPHFIVPTVVVIATYRLVPLLMGGRGFNVRQIGRYYLPDLLLLLALAVIPDLLQGIYMLITALVRRSRPGLDDRSSNSPDGNHDAVLPILRFDRTNH